MNKYIKYKLKYLKLKTEQTGGYSQNNINVNFYNDINKLANQAIQKTIIKYKNKEYTVYDDSKIIGGTKSRLIAMILSKIPEEEIIYAGPATGLAQVALAYVAKLYDKKATIFLSGVDKKNLYLVNKAKKYGAKIIIPKMGTLKHAQKLAKKYAEEKENRKLLSFGLKNPNNFRFFRVALYNVLASEPKPKRLWLVAGSGFLFEVLADIWPDTKFMIVQVGKKIWPDQLYNIKHELFVAPEKFTEDAISQPPFNAIPWYDAKLWQFFEKYHEEGDCIWNVGGLD